jgi:hypothetical protein
MPAELRTCLATLSFSLLGVTTKPKITFPSQDGSGGLPEEAAYSPSPRRAASLLEFVLLPKGTTTAFATTGRSEFPNASCARRHLPLRLLQALASKLMVQGQERG